MRTEMREPLALPEMQDLSEQIGEFIHYWGFKRVHGRIWTQLFLSEQPMDASDLVREMRISKALVSISLRELMEFDVVIDAGKSARGTNLYRTNPDILSVILNVLRQREKRMLSRIQAAQESLDRVRPEDKAAAGLSEKRMEQLNTLVQNASFGLENLIALRSIDFGEWRNAFMAGDDNEAPAPTGNADANPQPSGSQSAIPGSLGPMSSALTGLTAPGRFSSRDERSE